ncbi:MAG: hypothetical protein L0Y60_17840, partial [Beijerinckiaceae bacterium]|nr:hypothetical protein [Beijerinckiaceae bacterium]
ELATKQNDLSLAMPDMDTLYQGGLEKARESKRAYADLAAGPSTLTGRAAGLLGEFGGFVTDPEAFGLNALGYSLIPQGGPLAVAALRSAAGFAAGQLAVAADSFAYKQAIDPDYGYGDVAIEAAEAAGLGAVFPVAGAGLAAIWRRLRTTAPTVAATIPKPLQDAGNVAERVADLDANNPFKTGLTGAAVHRDTVTQISLDLAAGRDPAPVPLADAEAKVPTGQVFLGNRAVDVKYELAEARDLVTSHDRDFNVNPAYPAELQPRERANVASRAQVVDMAANLEPSRLGPSPEANAGAPIVGPDNVVESGNGRVMAIRNAYGEATNRAGAYRGFLEQSGYDTSKFAHPVLIARRVTAMSPEERAAFAQSANASASLRMSTMEQAIADARHIGRDIVPLLKPGDMASAANRDFAKAFVAKLPIGERGGLVTQGGALSAAGLQRLRAAAVARAYGDPAIVARAFEHPEPNIKTIASALSEAAPEWIRLRDGVAHGEIPPGHDITPDLMNAVKAIMKARDLGRPMHEILNQGDLFHADMTSLAATLFFKDAEMKRFFSKSDMADNLAKFARDIRTSAEGGPNLFGQEPISPQEAFAAQRPRTAPTSPEELAQIEGSPELHDAMIADLRRDIDRGDAILGMTEDGKPIFADPEFHAAEQQEMLAKEIGNCAMGTVEGAVK